MSRKWKIVLILIAIICFGVALSYPIGQYIQEQQNLETMDMLMAMRDAGKQNAQITDAPEDDATESPAETEAITEAPEIQTEAPSVDQPEETAPAQTDAPSVSETEASDANQPEETPDASTAPESTEEAASNETPAPTDTPAPTASPTPSPTPDRRVYTGALSWAQIEKVPLDVDKILPQYKDLYDLNNEMVGWLTIPGTKIDYPVMLSEDNTYYLDHDFMHKDNENGLLILDNKCDPYTPSYHQVVSGHNRKNNLMFSNLYDYYNNKDHWRAHKFVQYDSLMEERTYVVFAAFYSADYDVDEEGFRYNADLQYSVDVDQWVRDINANKLYDTGVDVKFGDEFLTLTTCNSRRKNGRFVVVCRRVRDGETFD